VANRVARTARQRLAANTRPVAVTLRDGARLWIRPLLPTDRGKLADAQPGFSRESHYRRFFSAPPLSAKVIEYLIDVDYVDHFAWAALAADEPGQPGVASARYIRERGAPDTAEVAFSVVDDYQGRGLGTFLYGALGVAARENGVRRFRARVLAENEPMRAVLRRAGAPLEFAEPGVLETVVDVPAFGEGLPDLTTAHALRDTTRDVVVAADLALGAVS
jgi:RimJ/RimL family protein N-acetyltransferase